MRHFLISIAILSFNVIPQNLVAQLPSLQDKLFGKDRVEEIMDIVDAHYAEIASGKRLKTDEGNYKHWARWGLYMSARTDEAGRLVYVDKHIREAYKSYSSQQRISTGNWAERGPTAISGTNGSAIGIGRVDRIAFHPTDANILYVGTPSGGLFKSINGGITWTSLTDNIPSTAISGIVVSHADPNTIFILTGDGDSSDDGLVHSSGYWRASAGMFVTYDAGVNWYARPLPITVEYDGYQLIQDPNNASVLLAATNQGVYRTTNSGYVWTEVLDGITHELKFKPGSSSVVYATQSGAFHKSTDGGISWQEITDFDYPLPYERVALAISEGFSNHVYLLSGWAVGGPIFGGVFLSTDNGESFTRQSNTPNIVENKCDGNGGGGNQSGYDLAIGVSHVLSNRVVAAGITTWRSWSTGTTWLNASAGRCDAESESTGFVHADVHDIEYNPLNGHVYLCSDGGLIKSVNHGLDWINLSDGIAASQVYHLAGTPLDIDNMIIGLQDNGCKRRNANTTIWDQVLSADGYDCIYNDGSATAGYLTSNSSIDRFWNNGANLEDVSPDSNNFFPRITSAINNGAIVLAGYADIYKSTNSGSSWLNKSASGTWDLERCPSNANRFYAAGGSSCFATTGSMYRSADQGDTWTIISNKPGYPTANIRLTDIGVRPNASGNVWITFGGFSDGNKVFYSNDVGETWSNMSGSLPNVPINAIQVDINNNVYIGTDIGVFYRGSATNDWVPFWHRLPIVPVSDLELYEAEGIIRASTFGRGVWESDTYSTCSVNLALGGTLSGHRYYETSDQLLTTALISGGQNTSITFKSGNYVLLTTGFEAPRGNTLRAYIAPCGVAQNED